MVAFRVSLSSEGQQQLKAVLLARTRQFASSLPEMLELPGADREEVGINIENIFVNKIFLFLR